MSATIPNNDILALEAAGLEVETAQNYPEGVEKLDETSPDLVIIDEMLPVVNGREACSRLRQMSDIPIILLSTNRSGQAVARANPAVICLLSARVLSFSSSIRSPSSLAN